MIAVPKGAERVVIHPAELDQVAESLQLRDSHRRHVVSLGPGVAQRPRQQRRVRRRQRADDGRARQRRRAAEGGGDDARNVVSARVYLPDGAVFQQMNAVYRKYFAAAPPARATVVAGLAGAQYAVEITLVASSSPEACDRRRTPREPQPQRRDSRRQPRLRLGDAGQHGGDQGRRRGADAGDTGAHQAALAAAAARRRTSSTAWST